MMNYMDETRLRVNQFLFSKVTEGQFGWFAGAVDFDGGFYIRVRWKSNGGIKSFAPELQITNTNPLIFRKMRAMGIEAIVRPRKRIMKEDGSGLRKQAYVAILYPEDMRMVLPKTINELAAKSAQCKAMLKALDLLKIPKSEARDCALIELRGEIMMLNQKEWPLEAWP